MAHHTHLLPVNARWLRLAGRGQERVEMAQACPVWHKITGTEQLVVSGTYINRGTAWIRSRRARSAPQ